uniref:Spermatogenesis-associated protein 6 N-terminal domain-containing protein n=1 Tax=Glossina brevipalpis TaxID=37001 RepID=A0A1A9WH99_9MUSC
MEVEIQETFQQQALEIREPGDNFDPNIEPKNGEEYLMHMLYERKRCPAVVAKRPTKIMRNEPLYIYNDNSTWENQQLTSQEVSTDVNLLPTKEWKSIQGNEFLRTRSKIIMLRQHLSEHNYDNDLESPLINDDMAWLKFCRDNEPRLSLMLRLNQRTLEQLLSMLNMWLEEDGDCDSAPVVTSSSTSSTNNMVLDLSSTDHWLGSWLYAVLGCLHLPLEPDNPLGPEIKIKYVTVCTGIIICPGVWLCSHGYLELTLKTMGYFYRTNVMEPLFPLLHLGHYKIRGYLFDCNNKEQLLENLVMEPLEITLWQSSRRLAYYKGNLLNLTQTKPNLQCPHYDAKQLLLTTTAAFPGIIAPKLDLSVKFSLNDHLQDSDAINLTTACHTKKPIHSKLQNIAVYSHHKSYEAPCSKSLNVSLSTAFPRKQKPVCHSRNISPNKAAYHPKFPHRDARNNHLYEVNDRPAQEVHNLEKPVSSYLEPGHNHLQSCELCRLYQQVFL